MFERDTIVDEVGEFLERLGRRLSHVERDQRREERREQRHSERAERMAERAEHMAERFRMRFGMNWGDDDATVNAETDGPTVERELVFGEQPELRLTAGPMSVKLLQVEAGGKTRLELRGRDAHEAEIEVGNWDGAVAVEVRPIRGFRGFRNFSRMTLYLYLPEGVRVRGRVDAGAISAEGLTAGELDLRADAGKLRLEHCHGRMRLTSSAGKITLEHCDGALEVRTDAGKIQLDEFSGTLQARAEAGAIHGRRIRLTEGQHSLETKLGSIDLTLVPGVPLKVEARASLGSVNNKIGDGPADAPAVLTARAELGSIRLRYDEEPPTPLRSVPVMDERGETPGQSDGGYKPVDLHQEPEAEQHDAAAETPRATAAPEAATTEAPQAAAPDAQSETLRILGMLERHEISAGDAATLLAALRR